MIEIGASGSPRSPRNYPCKRIFSFRLRYLLGALSLLCIYFCWQTIWLYARDISRVEEVRILSRKDRVFKTDHFHDMRAALERISQIESFLVERAANVPVDHRKAKFGIASKKLEQLAEAAKPQPQMKPLPPDPFKENPLLVPFDKEGFPILTQDQIDYYSTHFHPLDPRAELPPYVGDQANYWPPNSGTNLIPIASLLHLY